MPLAALLGWLIAPGAATAGSITLACPPPAEFPTNVTIVEGQLAPIGVGQIDSIGTIQPPDVNVNYEILGGTGLRLFTTNNQNATFVAPWAPGSPSGFEYHHFEPVYALPGASSGSPYTVNVTLQDPNGCGPSPTPTAFTVNVTTASSPTMNVVGGDGQVANINQPFLSPLTVQVNDNGMPMIDVVVTATVISGSAGIREPGGSLYGSSATFFSDIAGFVDFEVAAGAAPGPVQIEFSAPGFTPAVVTANLMVNAPAATLTCPPPATQNPPPVIWLEGQIAFAEIGETLAAAMAPPPVNAAWRIDGNPSTVEFVESLSNQFDEMVMWTEITPGQFQYASGTGIKFKAGSSGGSSQMYTIRAYANDPGGCGTFMNDRTFNLTVQAPIAPSVTQNGQPSATSTAPNTQFPGTWDILVTDNGVPVPNMLVRFNTVSGDGGFGPPGPPPGPEGRPPPVTEVFVTTNGAGIAQVAVIAGATPGALLVRASSPDFAPGQEVNLNLTVTGGLVQDFIASPTANSPGSPYGAVVGTFNGNYQVIAQESNGGPPLPVQGVPVRFTLSGDAILEVNGSPVGTNTVVTTDAAGLAAVDVIAGTTTVGAVYTLTAQVDSGSFAASPVTWHLVNLAEPNIGSIVITGGNNQVIEPGQSFANLDFDVIVTSIRAPEGAIAVTLDILQGDATFPVPQRGLDGLTSTTVFAPFAPGTHPLSVPIIAGTTEGPVTVRVDAVGFAPQQYDLAIQSATPPPTTLEAISGGQQSAIAGAGFASPLVVALPAGFTPPSPTTPFSFTVVSGDVFLVDAGNTVRSLTVVPDGQGRAAIAAVAGAAAGNAVVQVDYPDLNGVQFPLTVLPSPTAILLDKLSGDNQSAPINTRLAAPLVVGTAGSGTLAWRVVRGSANLVGATNGVLSTTLTNGIAQAQVVLGATVGPVEVEVSGQGFQSTRFLANATAPLTNYRIEKLSGDNQVLRINNPGDPLRIRVTDGGVPLTNFNVSWTFQGPGTLDTNTTTTDALGQSQVVFTPLNSGISFVRATVTNPNGGAQASADFTLDTPIAVLRLLTLSQQSGAVGSLADEDFVFQLTQNNQALGGELVEFSLVGPGSLNVSQATTDGTGKVFVRLRYGASAGPVIVTASALSGAATATASATAFVPGLSAASGNNQTGLPGETLPQPLVVQISQPPGTLAAKGLGGVPVLWSVTCGGGSLESASTLTDAQGRSSNRLTLGPQPGCNDVKANVVGVGEFLFSATGAPPASGIQIVSGDAQQLAPGEPSAPLVVRVVNASGQPVPDVRVAFGSGDSTAVEFTPVEMRTDAQGLAQTVARLNIPGQFQIRAKAPDFPDLEPKIFTLTASLANTDNLPPAVRDVAAVIDNSCVALSQLANPTPLQRDLLQRCSELVANANTAPGDVSNALNTLQADEGTAQNQVALAIAKGQFDNLTNRMTALRNGSASNGFQNGLSLITNDGALQMGYLPGNILGLNAAEEPEAGAQFSRWGFFASGTIGRGKRDPFEDDPGFDFRTYGVTAGVDYRLNDAFVLGAAVGFNRNDSDVRGNRGSTETKGTSLSGYVSWYHPRSFYLDGVLSIGQTTFDIERRISYSIPAAGGGRTQVNQIASASPDGDQMSASLAFGKDWNHGAWAVGPYARLNYTRIDFDAYTEEMSNPNGLGAGLALSVDSREVTSLQGVFGGKVSYTASTSWGVLVPYAQLEWVKEFEDDPGEIVSRFAFDPTRTAIIIENDAIDTDYLNFGLGLSGVFANGKSAFLYYERVVGQDRMSSDSLAAGLRIEF